MMIFTLRVIYFVAFPLLLVGIIVPILRGRKLEFRMIKSAVELTFCNRSSQTSEPLVLGIKLHSFNEEVTYLV